MNLKESFRYQNFLDEKLKEARYSLTDGEHCLTTTKTHLRNKANSEAEDITEVVEVDEFFPNDDVLSFMVWLVAEREKLTTAIANAKAGLNFCLDAAIEANKFRQSIGSSVQQMLKFNPTKRVEKGRDYKFNVEGNQMAYIYDIETTTEEAFDRVKSKTTMRELVSKADEVSAQIDLAMINTKVDYEPKFDVNDTFEDVMTDFTEKVLKAAKA